MAKSPPVSRFTAARRFTAAEIRDIGSAMEHEFQERDIRALRLVSGRLEFPYHAPDKTVVAHLQSRIDHVEEMNNAQQAMITAQQKQITAQQGHITTQQDQITAHQKIGTAQREQITALSARVCNLHPQRGGTATTALKKDSRRDESATQQTHSALQSMTAHQVVEVVSMGAKEAVMKMGLGLDVAMAGQAVSSPSPGITHSKLPKAAPSYMKSTPAATARIKATDFIKPVTGQTSRQVTSKNR